MTSAKEMFENAGYKLYENTDKKIVYRCGSYYIEFDKEKKKYNPYRMIYSFEKWARVHAEVYLMDLNAIKKQKEELGWNYD